MHFLLDEAGPNSNGGSMNDAPSPRQSALVVGASGGIGSALVRALCHDPRYEIVYALSRTPGGQSQHKVIEIACDPLNSESLSSAVSRLDRPISRAIITTGMLHDELQSPEKSWRSLNASDLTRSFAINSVAPALALAALIPHLPRKERSEIAVLGARVGSISDNRNGGWYGYRASKAALAMLIKTLSIDLSRTHPACICAMLHPGTVDTEMSKPFQGGVTAEKLFNPAFSAKAMLGVLDHLKPTDSGDHFAWDGSRIPA
jgi:NAD(P)-dependent dehydrogenase (short-subunit alcohol dehydrogenase family)